MLERLPDPSTKGGGFRPAAFGGHLPLWNPLLMWLAALLWGIVLVIWAILDSMARFAAPVRLVPTKLSRAPHLAKCALLASSRLTRVQILKANAYHAHRARTIRILHRHPQQHVSSAQWDRMPRPGAQGKWNVVVISGTLVRTVDRATCVLLANTRI